MRKLTIITAVMFAAIITASCGNINTGSKSITETITKEEKVEKIEIDIKDYGIVIVELDRTAAPITVDNFIKLVENDFYNGLTFHRIIDGFMMQGGDPLGNGLGGADEYIKGEFEKNGVHNPLSHTKGAISMARSQHPDSASSQFFIVDEDSIHLDGRYAAFGYVKEGQDIIDKICANALVEGGDGIVLPENQPVINTIRVIE